MLPVIVNYETALELYFVGEYKKALLLWEKYPLDPPSAAMMDRCELFIKNKTQLVDGAYSMTEK